ncbi:MAG: helix-turn-helix transcriptional regulator [Gammaproteobacteria bacterium]|nr:ArsR family transcriptional regulator [Gammaproteobacteria bacterium]NNC96647.1 helix-turn-helix transcriptional regulator [Gammaproteobacteria bacterium]NNM14287.1 helix-turn-helix transcriptional regulator [Gammaproteobacteria bacterium]
MDINTATPIFAALAHATRLRVFRSLVEAGPDGLSAGQIAAQLNVVQNTMSSHLNTLTQNHLITKQRNGRKLIYRANYECMSDVITFLLQDCCNGSQNVSESVSAAIACN